MATYKSYVLVQGDTVEQLAQKFLGDVSRAAEIISLNRLRSPFISDDPYDQLGPVVASAPLASPLTFGASSLDCSYYVSAGLINQSTLMPQSTFFIRSTQKNGEIIQDKFSIKLYYPYDISELSPDGSTYSVVPAGTLKFDTPIVSSPTTSAYDEGMLQTTSYAVFSGYINGTTLTVSRMISGNLALGMVLSGSNVPSNVTIIGNINSTGGVGTYTISQTLSLSEATFTTSIPSNTSLPARNYYVRYSYQTISGETLPGPYRIEESNGAAIPLALQNSAVGDSRLLVVSAPLTWPSGVISVRVYIGTRPGADVLQGTLYNTTDLLVEPTAGFSYNQSPPPSVNSAYLGLVHSYSIGTKFSIHDNSSALNTQVLRTGSTILLPSLVPPRAQLVVNNASSNQFIDELGTDLKLDGNGFLTFDGSAGVDLTTVSGINNVRQSVKGRLLTRMNELKTQPKFGNGALEQIGAKYSAAFLQIVKTSLVETLKKEPRIVSIGGMRLTYDSAIGSVIINNLSLQITNDGTSAYDITFEPIALPI